MRKRKTKNKFMSQKKENVAVMSSREIKEAVLGGVNGGME